MTSEAVSEAGFAPRVALVGASALAREAIRCALAGRFDLVLTEGSAGALGTAARPDVVVGFSFLKRPEDLGDLVRAAQVTLPGVPFVALAPFTTRDEVLATMAIGAAACVSAEGGLANLDEAIATVPRRTYLCPRTSALLRQGSTRAVAAPNERPRLTPRQLQILAMIADGCTDREIAASCRLSIRTVNTHRANVMARLRVRNATQLVRRARQLRLIDDA